jgi:hypothetical protein
MARPRRGPDRCVGELERTGIRDTDVEEVEPGVLRCIDLDGVDAAPSPEQDGRRELRQPGGDGSAIFGRRARGGPRASG